MDRQSLAREILNLLDGDHDDQREINAEKRGIYIALRSLGEITPTFPAWVDEQLRSWADAQLPRFQRVQFSLVNQGENLPSQEWITRALMSTFPGRIGSVTVEEVKP